MSDGQDQSNDQEIQRRLTSNTVTSQTEEPKSTSKVEKDQKKNEKIKASASGNYQSYSKSITSKYLSNTRGKGKTETKRATGAETNKKNYESKTKLGYHSSSSGNFLQAGSTRVSQAQIHRANAINNVKNTSQSGVHVTPGRKYESRVGNEGGYKTYNSYYTSGETYLNHNSITMSPRTSNIR